MTLNEALSLGLNFRQEGMVGFYSVDPQPIYFTVECVKSNTWEVKLPSGYVTSSFETATYFMGYNRFSNQMTEASKPEGLTSPMAKEILGEWVASPDVCECGSEAMGGKAHSLWCPKHK